MTLSTTTASLPTSATSAATAAATGARTALRTALQPTLDALASQFSDTLAQAMESAVPQRPTTPTAQETTPSPQTDAAGVACTVTKQPGSSYQAPWLKGAEDAGQYLLAASADHDTRHSGKPDIATFMESSGADFSTASSLLYGVVGSNTDYRDWKAIMGSADPVLAARQATGALYNSDLPYTSSSGFKPSASQTVAASGNYAFLKVEGRENLWLMNNRGEALRQVRLSAPDILRASRNFGFDTSDLTALADQMDAKGVAYMPGALAAGSNHGVDLRALARGGMGAAYDWTSDPLAHLKGDGARDALAADVQLAHELGLKPWGAAAARTSVVPAASAASGPAATVPSTATTVSAAAAALPAATVADEARSLEDLGKQLTDTLLAQLQNALQTWKAQNGTAA